MTRVACWQCEREIPEPARNCSACGAPTLEALESSSGCLETAIGVAQGCLGAVVFVISACVLLLVAGTVLALIAALS